LLSMAMETELKVKQTLLQQSNSRTTTLEVSEEGVGYRKLGVLANFINNIKRGSSQSN